MRYAVLDDDLVVQNLLEADEAFMEAEYPGHWAAAPETEWVGIGFIYDPVTQTYSDPG